MTRKTLADVDDDAQIYVTTNRSSGTKRVHLAPDCRHLQTATNPIIEKTPAMYPDSKPVCLSCTGSPPKGPNDRSIYEAACAAGEADE